MSAIKSTHDLLDLADGRPAPPAGVRHEAKRSSYCYLFPELSDPDLTKQADAGCFEGTDEETTVSRLKKFELACQLPSHGTPAALLIQLPAAYTYFGQFVNHDISAPIGGLLVNVGKVPPAGIIGTADPAGLSKEWRKDTATILEHFVNEHAVPLSLESLYGDGPASDDPEVTELYEADGKRFRLATTRPSTTPADDQFFEDRKKDPAKIVHATGAPDILRRDRKPLIADRRNDGNLILSQLHLAFMLFHNKAVDALEQPGQTSEECFRQARQLVTLHYHWLILNDYLPKLMSTEVLRGRPLATWVSKLKEANKVPMEFTTAAFRFGHSMIGRAYDFNENFGVGGRISTAGASLADLFDFTSRGNMQRPDDPTQQLPDHWVIDWDRMTRPPRPAGADADALGGAEQIDLNFAPDMLNLVGESNVPEHGSILFRNLMRGFHRRMPFGQKLAEQYPVPRLCPEQVLSAMPEGTVGGADFGGAREIKAVAKEFGIDKETPAWLYLLCEARVLEGGERLGPTASHIIGDTLVGLMAHNPNSILRQDNGRWHPRDSLLKDGQDEGLVSLRDFLLFATKPASRAN